jgi:hypothetical protein
MNIEEVKLMLEKKNFILYYEKENKYYYKIYINRKNKRYNIEFKIKEITNNIVTVQELELCTCQVACCGRKFNNFIIENKKQFEQTIDNYIKQYHK